MYHINIGVIKIINMSKNQEKKGQISFFGKDIVATANLYR
jgi:hypothetical protein